NQVLYQLSYKGASTRQRSSGDATGTVPTGSSTFSAPVKCRSALAHSTPRRQPALFRGVAGDHCAVLHANRQWSLDATPRIGEGTARVKGTAWRRPDRIGKLAGDRLAFASAHGQVRNG